MISTDLNLARKWRPQNFSEVVGQELSIRMLQNGLFLKKYFPLYIFAGQRGCGKTTTARIFAAAMNCINLDLFQKDPKNIVPCSKCNSCLDMLEKQHPDFIEMDAASHTGVDNVRQILESATFVALNGRAKIYLIDEAHMLSRAAFNAFLKVLEEPPASVFFILATTELNKIPDTIRSRAFHVFFNAIDSTALKSYLTKMCEKEVINIDSFALNIIISESGGSVRDSINLLEQVRLLNNNITEQLVLDALGRISEKNIFILFNFLIEKQPVKIILFLEKINFEALSPDSLWTMLINLCRCLIWIKYGAQAPAPFDKSKDLLQLADKCTIAQLNTIMQLFFSQEDLFLKTTQKHLFLETLLLTISDQSPGLAVSLSNQVASKDEIIDSWELLRQKIVLLNDQLLSSIFKQAVFKGFENKILILELANSNFFKDKLLESKVILKPIISEFYKDFEDFGFINVEIKPKTTPSIISKPRVDLSDKEKWPKTGLLLSHFSGKVEVNKK